VLFHGKNFCSAYWEQTANQLVKNGYRVVMPDQAGFGKSSKPQHIQYSFQLLAKQTSLLLAELDIKKVIVLGHSMGGMLASRFALMNPQMTEALILEDPIGLEDWKVLVPYQSVEERYEKEKAQSYEKIKKYEKENYYHGTWKSKYDKWVNIPAGWALNPNYDSIAWNSALTYDMIFTQPVIYEFENIEMPVLLIVGELDRTAPGKELVDEETAKGLGNYPVLGKKASEKIKSCKLVLLPGIGHIPHVEAFDSFIKEVLDFLKNFKS
jgi:pimeloyl-ACP methyl ester carboxylesterase